MTDHQQLILRLYDIGAIQFGQFRLRSGILSPVYLDLRKTVSDPSLIRAISESLWEVVKELPADTLCGVPYAALSFTSALSVMHDLPMIIKRKTRKKHGTGQLVEGRFRKGDRCIVLDDLITSGISMYETAKELEEEGFVISHLIAVIDRQQGGADLLREKGYLVHTLFTISSMLEVLLTAGKIDDDMRRRTLDFIEQAQIERIPVAERPVSRNLSYAMQAENSVHPVSRSLLGIMARKKTNLTVSADVESAGRLLRLAERVGPHICCLKTHTDILPDFSHDFIRQLRAIAEKHRFLLFEDRKFCDIGHIAGQQFAGGSMRIAEWADMATVHVVAGASSVQALAGSSRENQCGLIVVAQMSTRDTLTDAAYIKKAAAIAEANKDSVIGMVAQQRLTDDPGLLQFTPGIHLSARADQQGQTYNTPDIAFGERGTDVMIVGRGVYRADSPEAQAKAYQQAGWSAYLKRVSV